MKDLCGADVPDSPPMDAPLPWKVFKLNDCDWWLARTLEEAMADCRYQCGDVDFEDEHDLTDKELDRLMYCDEDCKTKIPFREALRERVEAGIAKPEMFASTEH
jgi:phage-related protein